jgi:hypothetical protein
MTLVCTGTEQVYLSVEHNVDSPSGALSLHLGAELKLELKDLVDG